MSFQVFLIMINTLFVIENVFVFIFEMYFFRFSWSWSTLFSSHRTAFCWSSQKLRQQLKLISSFSSTGETFSSFSSTGEPFWFSLFSCNHLWRRHLVALDVISSAIHSLTSFESSLQQIFVKQRNMQMTSYLQIPERAIWQGRRQDET